MAKLAVVGQDTSKMIDCSEAVPVPVPAAGRVEVGAAVLEGYPVLTYCCDAEVEVDEEEAGLYGDEEDE